MKRARGIRAVGAITAAMLAWVWGVFAQEATEEPAELGDIIVVAQKEPASAQDVPVSVTAAPRELLTDADVRTVKEAVSFAPNAVVVEFGPRRLSNPYVRGIGAGPTNPGVTTVIDGVPQLNASSSGIELLDVEQVEVVSGAQAALFGRNAMGGIINITSRRPSSSPSVEAEGILGDFGTFGGRVRYSGPMGEKGGFSLAAGYSARDGYVRNLLTGNDVDGREAWAGKAQIIVPFDDRLEGRLILFQERDRDGGYALFDLDQLRQAPRRVAYDTEGFSRRDILMPTFVLTYRADAFELTSTSGFVKWRTEELTDLDYSPAPLLTNRNDETQHQVTQEVRFSSRKGAGAMSGWQAGIFLFDERYARDRVVDLLPAMTGMPFSLREETTADISTRGFGIYGQAHIAAGDRVEFTVGMRCDSERAEATLGSVSAFGVVSQQRLERSFGEFSPQASAVYRFAPSAMAYVSTGRGYKAGGFNAGAPAGKEAYGEETCWSHEVGIKSEWNDGRIRVNAAAYAIRWDDLQLYVPNPLTPGNLYVDNAGRAKGVGCELMAQCRPTRGWEFFFSAGWADGEFSPGSSSQGADISGNRLPFLPEFTCRLGATYSRRLAGGGEWYARTDISVCGDYDYDASNLRGQDAFTTVDLRTGVRGKSWFAEAWVKNAFDADYVPVAFPYGALAPSGYLGESGPPRTFGVRAGIYF